MFYLFVFTQKILDIINKKKNTGLRERQSDQRKRETVYGAQEYTGAAARRWDTSTAAELQGELERKVGADEKDASWVEKFTRLG